VARSKCIITVKSLYFQPILSKNTLQQYCFPSPDRFADRLYVLHTDAYRGTIRVQICWNSKQGAQRVVWWFWHILDAIDGLSPLCPYLLINRTEEIKGSNPARSTRKPPDVGIFLVYAYIKEYWLVEWIGRVKSAANACNQVCELTYFLINLHSNWHNQCIN
jgi:hypothetical protein